MSCRICGAPTSSRLCRQCEIEQRAEERARARERMEGDHESEDDEDAERESRPDGGGGTLSEIDRFEAERRARQAARTLDQWSRIARVDLLEIVQEETPVAIGTPFLTSRCVSEDPTYHLTCRDCPFEAMSSGSKARDRLYRARDVHRTAFDHDVVVDDCSVRTDPPATQLQADGGSDR